MTPTEKAVAIGGAAPQQLYVNLGCAGVFAALPVGLVIWGLGKLGPHIGPGWTVPIQIAGGVAAIAAFFLLTSGLWRSVQKERAQYRADAEKGDVEVLEVQTGRVCELHGDHSSIDPILCIDLGENRLLLLVGQWTWEPSRYVNAAGKSPKFSEEEAQDYANGLPPPWSFPSARFVLKRLPQSGHVLSISPDGPYVKPADSKINVAAKDAREFLESQILQGSMDDIPRALEAIPRAKH